MGLAHQTRMNQTTEKYQDWKAPSQDGEILLWPVAGQFFEDVRENQKQLRSADRVRIGGVPLPELRRRMRS